MSVADLASVALKKIMVINNYISDTHSIFINL